MPALGQAVTSAPDQDAPALGSIGLFRLDIAADPRASSRIRARLRVELGRAGLPDLYEAAALVASEMVSNAVRHAGGAIVVEARHWGPWLLLLVRDTGSGHLQARSTDVDATDGRGLHLIEALSQDSGVAVERFGKTVWAIVGDGTWPSPGHRDLCMTELAEILRYWDLTVELLNFPRALFEEWRPRIQVTMSLLATVPRADDPGISKTGTGSLHALRSLDAGLTVEADVRHPAGSADPPGGKATQLVMATTAVPFFADLQDGARRAIAMADGGDIDIPAPRGELGAFREWLCREIRLQADGAVPQPWPSPAGTNAGYHSRHGDGGTRDSDDH